tara:strand:+ start:7048 stop:7248 length:201 start_codon:yes stop_codon:yes gene_type:complete
MSMSRTLQLAKDAKKLTNVRMYVFDEINKIEEVVKSLQHSGDHLKGYGLGEYTVLKKIFELTQGED